MSPAPRVAVVLVNFNGGELILRALEAVECQTVRPARVIVVDNASTDGSADAIEARHPDIELVRLSHNTGFAAANNLAVRAADDCDWVALLNPDAFPEPEWLERLLGAARRRPEFGFFGSRMLNADRPDELDGAGDAYHVSGLAWRRHHGRTAAERALEEEEVFSPCAAAALYRRDMFLAAGGFDEDFFCYFEDNDLSFRLRLAGHRCLYVPDAVVRHVGSATAGRESDFTIYHSFRNLTWTWVKNMPAPLLWRSLPQHVLGTLLALGWYALRGRAGAALRGERDALRGLPRVLRERRRIQSARRIGPAELGPVLERGLGAFLDAYRRTARSTSASTARAGSG
jgi:GT2 family glycosyltransferase